MRSEGCGFVVSDVELAVVDFSQGVLVLVSLIKEEIEIEIEISSRPKHEIIS